MLAVKKITYAIVLLSFPYLTLADEKDKGGVCYFDPPNVQPKKAKDNQITLFGVDNFALYATLGEMYYRYKGLVVEKSSDNVPFIGLGSQFTFNIGEMGKLFLAANISKTDKGRGHGFESNFRSDQEAKLDTEYSFERMDWSVSLGLEESCFGFSWKPLTCFVGYKSGKTTHHSKQVAYVNPVIKTPDNPNTQYVNEAREEFAFKALIENPKEQLKTKGAFLGITLKGNPFNIWKNTNFNLTLAATKLNSEYSYGIGNAFEGGSDSTIGYTGKVGFNTSLGSNWTLNGTVEGFSYKLQSVALGGSIKAPIEETLVAGSLSFSKRW